MEAKGEPWFFTAVYGSPLEVGRRSLWKRFHAMARNIQGLWLLMGDFNAILFDHERSGSGSRVSRSRWFEEWFRESSLIDVGFSGPKFTWVRGNSPSSFKGVRLDRAICNMEWRDRFSKASILHLPRICSDHCPLLLSVDEVNGVSLNRNFKFQAACLIHPGFKDWMKDTWTSF